MRVLTLALISALAGAGAAVAAPASVTVSVAPELQKTFEKSYGVREADRLTVRLQSSVERALARTGAYNDAQIALTLTDVKPNRPTFKQLGDKPGLSLQSFGIGGAAITGRVVAADGRETPLTYRWFETDIENSYANWVWSDAEWAFDRFARRLASGRELAQR